MKVAVLYQPGGPDKLLVEERPIPTPRAGQVLVRVKAFGLNRSELMTRKGLSPNVEFPRVLGIECVGQVEFDPSGAYQKGQQVLALMGGMGRDFDGSYGEYTLIPKALVHPFDSTLSWEMLGAIPEMFQTAYGSLYPALAIQPGETLLIRGGSSSIGMLATQLASLAGLTVLATTRKPQKESELRANGAAHVLIDEGRLTESVRSIFPEGIDKVLELVGTSTLQDSLSCLKPGGTGCMSGMLAENWTIPKFAPMEFIPVTVRLTTFDSGQITSPTAVFQDFIRRIEAGHVKLAISRTFTLDKSLPPINSWTVIREPVNWWSYPNELFFSIT
jgi:NADPH2:quinone reductase